MLQTMAIGGLVAYVTPQREYMDVTRCPQSFRGCVA